MSGSQMKSNQNYKVQGLDKLAGIQEQAPGKLHEALVHVTVVTMFMC